MNIQLTADGSQTLYIPEFDEHYHSVNGAIQESRHVYIEAGLNQCKKQKISVLELGFGTGLNALLTCFEAVRQGLSILYTGLEKFPLSSEIINQLNYGRQLGPDEEDLFSQIHACQWEKENELNPFFTLCKRQTDFTTAHVEGNYDVVFYDAFAPDKQVDAWSQEIMDRLFRAMNTEGILTTYCAKGNIRRMMQQAGFTVEKIPGPPGKREMIRAVKLGD